MLSIALMFKNAISDLLATDGKEREGQPTILSSDGHASVHSQKHHKLNGKNRVMVNGFVSTEPYRVPLITMAYTETAVRDQQLHPTAAKYLPNTIE